MRPEVMIACELLAFAVTLMLILARVL